MSRTYGWLLAAALLGAAAGDAWGAMPATAPADSVATLIARLGDPSFRTRRDATNRLLDVGKPAVAPLREAVRSGGPEVRLRAREILRLLERRPVPDKPFDTDDDSTRLTITTDRGAQTLDVYDAGQKVRIRESDAGIEMTVTGEVDFEPVTETYRAKTPQELKENEPGAFALYERWARQIGPTFGAGRAGRPDNMRQGPFLLSPPLGAADDLVILRHSLSKAMHDVNLSRPQMRQVADAWARVRQEWEIGLRSPLAAGDRQMDRYNRACDNLRKVLADLHLPDPGDALPPPAGARLGVQAVVGFDESAPVTVSHVMADSRAQKLGLLPGDVIQVVNGEPVRGVRELRRLVTVYRKGLVIEGTRNGKKLRLEEKP